MAVKQVVLARPRGFCAGVEMAIAVVERALEKYGPPIYVFHEIVHNRHVVERFSQKGVVFVQSVADIPAGARLIFSAHGVSPAVWQAARAREIQPIIDATCPLVEKVHREVRRFAAEDYWIILVGHKDHDEIVGTSGEAPERIQIVGTAEEAERVRVPDPDKVVALTQTTLSVDDTAEIMAILRRRFPRLVTPSKDDICYATQNRQDAVKKLARETEFILVIGSPNSENSNQLCRVARAQGVKAMLVNDVSGIEPEWFKGVSRLGITSGASVPEELVQDAVDYFRARGAAVREIGFAEQNIHFTLPSEVS
ncbi:MAG TPA: 4-hydroxy-3-methylbut-2-enyl diphosphate reductase [Candidatus Acidoferrales bacterium]|nr:4-hydroxy-3-methylbut-2-enyl diphosphate reductase [Candidatus Acidoferrales bacterium]